MDSAALGRALPDNHVNYIDETLTDLEALIAADFRRPLSSSDMEGELHSWLHYRARLIPQRPRKAIWSANAQAAALRIPAVRRIAAVLEAGGDVSPWLSNRVRMRKDDNQADLLFNDWQISHFHTSEIFSTSSGIRRRDDLLFAFVRANYAVLLDVLPHKGSWTNQDLIRTLLRTSPRDVPELHGIRPPREPPDGNETKRLREARMNGFIVIEDKVYMAPGFGLSGSGSATRIVRFADKLMLTMRDVGRAITANNPLVVGPLAGQIGLPVTLGLRFQGGLFTVYEKQRRHDITHIGPLE